MYKNPHSTAAEKDVAEKRIRCVTDRVEETWTLKRNAELCELSAKDPSQFWKAFKAPQSNACPVEMSAQFEAFRALMGAEPQSAPQRPADSGVSTSCPYVACLNADISVDKLSQCIKRLKRGRILDIIKSLDAHDSAAVRSPQGISVIFRCLMGVKQGCLLSPTLFGLYVDGLEKHLLETADIDAPTLMGVMVPLLLYADDLILIPESASGLQKQLDASASFYLQRQLTVSLSKTKVVVFETRQSGVCDFVLSGAAVDSYKNLGFVFHATKN